MYTLYIKEHVRMAFHKRDCSYLEAIKFLENHPYAVVKDKEGTLYKTKEELENAENIRSNFGFGSHNAFTSGGYK